MHAIIWWWTVVAWESAGKQIHQVTPKERDFVQQALDLISFYSYNGRPRMPNCMDEAIIRVIVGG